MYKRFVSTLCAGLLLAAPVPALAADAGHWWSGDWYLKVGAAGFAAPRYEGSKGYLFQVAPLVSLGKSGNAVRFSSRTDNPSFAFLDRGAFRAGLTGRLVPSRDAGDSADLIGLDSIRFGVELGGFAEVYPTDWLRVRGEVRHGIRSHTGVVADLSADAFVDLTPDIRVSAGPRVSLASNDAMDAYYRVTPAGAARSGLTAYDPGGGVRSAGVAAEINWRATDRIETGAFAEYRRLTGPAADSSLVRERGSRDQFLVGVSATYRFDFTIP